jgi:hypothetical protein
LKNIRINEKRKMKTKNKNEFLILKETKNKINNASDASD